MAHFDSRSSTLLLEHDPDLLGDLDAADARAAAEQSRVRVGNVPRGPWRPAEQKRAANSFGLYIVGGLLARNVTVGERTCAEVLGPGDILRPWVATMSGAGSIDSAVEWSAVTDAEIAVLDGGFVQRMGAWPAVISALGDRVMLRAHWLAFHLAVCHMRRVDERLMIVLWHLADRWGRVTTSGTVVPLPLTHALLAKIVGAQRPTVSSALSELEDAGMLTRGEQRSWVLHGEAPDSLAELRSQPTGDGRLELRDGED